MLFKGNRHNALRALRRLGGKKKVAGKKKNESARLKGNG